MGYGNSVSIDLFTKKISILTGNAEKTAESFPVDIFSSPPTIFKVEGGDFLSLNQYISQDKYNRIITSELNRGVYSSLQNTAANFSPYIENQEKDATIILPLGSLGISVANAGSGASTYTSPGTYSWTCPDGVTSVSVVSVGAGGSGGYQWSSGGGGGLGWKNNIPVTPGQTYTVVVGDKGSAVANANNNAGAGGNSYFIDTTTVCGFGAGQGGTGSTASGFGSYGGGYTGDGGGVGGNGAVSGSWTHGGGGGGGYSGNGASRYNDTVATGGAGGAGQYYSSTFGVGAGGGVGIYGEGASGLTYADGTGYGGRGGSGGGDGMAGETANSSSENIWERTASVTTATNNQILGGQFGGGGGGSGTSRGGGYGGTGAVRIIWGEGLSFPSSAPNVGSYIDGGTPVEYQLISNSLNLDPITYNSNYYNFSSIPSSKSISISYLPPENSITRGDTLIDISGKKFIKTQKDLAFFTGVNSNSQRVEFRIANNIDLIYIDENGISKFEQIDKENNPRPIVISQGTAEEISTGPVQSWF